MLHGAGAVVQREVQHQVGRLVSRLFGLGASVPQPAEPKQGGPRRTGVFFIIMINFFGYYHVKKDPGVVILLCIFYFFVMFRAAACSKQSKGVLGAQVLTETKFFFSAKARGFSAHRYCERYYY